MRIRVPPAGNSQIARTVSVTQTRRAQLRVDMVISLLGFRLTSYDAYQPPIVYNKTVHLNVNNRDL